MVSSTFAIEIETTRIATSTIEIGAEATDTNTKTAIIAAVVINIEPKAAIITPEVTHITIVSVVIATLMVDIEAKDSNIETKHDNMKAVWRNNRSSVLSKRRGREKQYWYYKLHYFSCPPLLLETAWMEALAKPKNLWFPPGPFKTY